MPIDYKIYNLLKFSRESLTFNSNNIILSDISSIILSDLVTTIAPNTFEGLTNLKTIEFGKNLISIGDSCFTNTALKTIIYDGIEYNKETQFRHAFAGDIGSDVFTGTQF